MDILDKLVERFRTGESERKLIFWYDTNLERDLEPIRETLRPLDVEIWELKGELKEDNQFITKYQLEVVAPRQSYLVHKISWNLQRCFFFSKEILLNWPEV